MCSNQSKPKTEFFSQWLGNSGGGSAGKTGSDVVKTGLAFAAGWKMGECAQPPPIPGAMDATATPARSNHVHCAGVLVCWRVGRRQRFPERMTASVVSRREVARASPLLLPSRLDEELERGR